MAARRLSWLITGASSGFGQSIATAALRAGHKVIGATRDISKAEKTNPNFSDRGGIWVQLDPAQKDAYELFAGVSREHDIDVPVNNAGYAFIGGIEDTRLMEVNFYGPIRAIRACLPVMRAKNFGHVVLVSSGAGFIARPGRGPYSASKFAIEAIHESLVGKVETLGVKVLIHGGFSEPYKGAALDKMVSMSKGVTGVPPAIILRGCPDKAGREIVKAVDNGYDYLRMILGPDCVAAISQKLGSLHYNLEATKAIAMSTDIDTNEET
ncbi:hypothetical protein F5B21DRAFT_528155 [Xylaria acuta]|nr:hypothetical protein F5B21DRAFT_528155 [Xylaria acuta]